MKKWLLCCLMMLMSVVVSAATETIGNFTLIYSVSNGEAQITDCTNSSGALEIPSTIDGYPVTSIGNEAFSGCSSLTSVRIPSGVTTIGWGAFADCSSLTSLIIPDSVTTIDGCAFYGCSSLSSVTIPSNVTTIGWGAFADCSSLTSLIIPDSVTTIDGCAFYGCSSLSSVTIPSNVTTIGVDAFVYCSSLTSINVDIANASYQSIEGLLLTKDGTTLVACPGGLSSVMIREGVTTIGNGAFSGCSSLPSVTIPSNVTTIGESAFYDCPSLTSINVDIANASYQSVDGLLLTKDGTTLLACPGGLISVMIPEGVSTIGNGAFGCCLSLTSVTIPDSVTTIGDNAFVHCTRLTSVTIPKSVTSIGEWAFYYCASLTSLTIPSSVTEIGMCAFSGCSALTSVTIPKGVTMIGSYAFDGCSSLTSVAIPEGVTSIESGAFSGCSALTSVTIPEGVTEIGQQAFDGCTSLTSVTFEGEPPTVDDRAFYAVTATGYYVFEHATAWAAVIEEDGTWNGLTMELREDDAEDPTIYTVTVNVVGDGSVTGTGKYTADTEVTLTATPNEGMVFCGWSEESVKSSTLSFTMPAEAVMQTAYFADASVIKAYTNTNALMSKEEAKQALLDADEVFTADEMKELALGAPAIQVKNGKAIVTIQVKKAATLDGEWTDVEGGSVSVTVTPEAGENAAFYKFVVPEEQ